MISDHDEEDADYRLAPVEPSPAYRPIHAPSPVPHQPLRPGERIIAAQPVVPLPRPAAPTPAPEQTWTAALREELVSASFGSVTAVLAAVCLPLAAGLFLWGLSCIATGTWKPEVINGICSRTKVVVEEDRNSGKYKIIEDIAPWSTIDFHYKGRDYSTIAMHPAFGEFYFERGETAPVWIFYGMPSRAVVVPGSWEQCKFRHIRYMQSWGGCWIGLSFLSFLAGAILATIAVLRLNAVRRGSRNPYGLSLQFG